MLCPATRCRVSSEHLDDNVAMGDMKKWKFLDTLPSGEELTKMQHFYSIILARILCVRMKWMKEYNISAAVNWEIGHDYSKEQRQKSEEVVLPCISRLVSVFGV